MKENNMNIGIEEAIQHFFSTPSFDLIYSEAMANALDAGARNIFFNIKIYSFNKPSSLEIEIKDDGVGFTENNFFKFTELLKKSDNSHKGLGRLIYLKYFSKVEIESVFDGNKKRVFIFDNSFKGDSCVEIIKDNLDSYSKLSFKNFSNKQLNTYENVKASDIKNYLLKQFLPRLFALKQYGEHFCITIDTDVTDPNPDRGFYSDTQTITENDLPDLHEIEIKDVHLSLFNEPFKILYTVSGDFSGNLMTAICVDERAIDIPLLKTEKVPEKISGIFLLSSPFLDSKIDDSRQELLLMPDERKVIEEIFAENISTILSDNFPEIAVQNEKISQKLSTRYPHLEGYFSKKTICLIDENKTLEDAQNKFFKEQKEILGAAKLNDDLYNRSFSHSTRVLTEYILYRNIIIDRLKEITGDEKEAQIHNLIVPMKKTFKAKTFINDLYTNNAWILDDKYMGYQSILSDENIEKLIAEISTEEELVSNDLRPDLAFVFSDDIEKAGHPVDVVIVELKKKGLGFLDNSRIIDQLEQRARRLLGFYPNKIQRMWFFGIVEFDKELLVKMREGWSSIYSGGQSYYRTLHLLPVDKNMNQIGDKTYPVSLTLLSFDALWKDAKARNEIFLSILRESIRKYVENSNL